MKGTGAIIIISILSFLLSFGSRAQIITEPEYNTEFIWGINKNTASGLIGGIIFKHSKALNSRLYRTLGLELINVKHSKEVRYNSVLTGNLFIWGKTNYLYAIRFQYGRDYIMFRKAPQQGVQITGMLSGGPTLGLLAPYYIEYSTGSLESSRVPYEPAVHDFRNILGTGRLFQGVPKSDIKLGLNVKTGMSFEFGTFKSNVTGFEVGFLVEAYTQKIILVPNADNRAVFPTAFITLFYGSRK